MANPLRLFAQASPEFRLVAACCRWPANTARSQAVQQALRPDLQWERVLSLALRHRVGGLVAHALAGLTDVPAEVRQALAKTQQGILLANMNALRVQARLSTLLHEHGILFAVLKGAPLAVQAFSNLSLRQSRDIDLLIYPEDMERVDDLLRKDGYRRAGLSAELAPHQQRLWMRHRKHYEYEHSQCSTRLEVHWRTTDNRYLTCAHDPLGRSEMAAIAPGLSLPVLPRTDLLLDLCAHGAGHAWFRLKWIADVAALLAETGEEGQHDLLRSACRAGLDRPVLQALYLCHALFGLPLVGEAQSLSRSVRRLLRIAEVALLNEDLTAPSATSDFVPKHLALSNLLLRRNWRYRAEELRLMLAAPADWQQVSLPSRMHFLYPLLRFPLWMKRRWLDRI